MPNTRSLDHLTLRSPDALVAALPYLLGFHPASSAVLVWLADGRILLTQRLDLPPAGSDPTPWLAAVWSHPAASEATEVVLVLVAAADDPADLAGAIRDEAERRSIHVRDMLRTDAGRWWSLLCAEPACCPPAGRTIDPQVRTQVAAEFALLGRAPAQDRDALVDQMASQPERLLTPGAVRARLAPTQGSARERWRDATIADVTAHLRDEQDVDAAVICAGLADVRVRDTVLWESVRFTDHDTVQAISRLTQVLRVAPPGFVAPTATVVAVLAWLAGDGARALVALDRALGDDGDYSLAALVAASLRAGLPPAVWRAAMADVGRRECRHGRRALGAGE